MIFHVLADLVVAFHGAYVVFVLFGALLALRWPWVLWVHLPNAIWGVLIEYAGWVCPLTPLENSLRAKAGEAAYSGGFIDHYVLRVLYPGGLTSRVQIVLGSFALVVNLLAYALLIRQVRARRAAAVAPAI